MVRDLAVVLTLALLAFVAAGRVEFSERFTGWAINHEHWQADELPFALLTLCGGLGWFAWRRWLETADLRRRNQALARHLMALQEEERAHLARELHDEMGQRCAAIRFEAQCVLRGLEISAAGTNDTATDAATDAAHRAGLAASAQAIADSAAALHGGVRRLLAQLRPAALDALGLAAAVNELLKDWQRTYRTPVAWEGAALGPVPESVAIGVYRIVQEALTNIGRHAQATQVIVRLLRSEQGLALQVIDDGKGFSESGPPGGFGYGLTGMTERVAGLGGHIRICGVVGQGVTLTVHLPLGREAGR